MSIDIQGQITYWLEGSDENIESALLLIRHSKALEGLFFAHLGLEKALKAMIVKKTGTVPPRSHNLLRLAELAEIPVNQELAQFLGTMMAYQLEGRYPSERVQKPAKEFSLNLCAECKRVIGWLKNQL